MRLPLRDDGLHAAVYQCLYCKDRVYDYRQLTQHEAFCPARAGIEHRWAAIIARAEAYEATLRLKERD
jgi:hypothetical protein